MEIEVRRPVELLDKRGIQAKKLETLIRNIDKNIASLRINILYRLPITSPSRAHNSKNNTL